MVATPVLVTMVKLNVQHNPVLPVLTMMVTLVQVVMNGMKTVIVVTVPTLLFNVQKLFVEHLVITMVKLTKLKMFLTAKMVVTSVLAKMDLYPAQMKNVLLVYTMIRHTKINNHGVMEHVQHVIVMMELYIVVMMMNVLAPKIPIVIQDIIVTNPHVMILLDTVTNVLKKTDACPKKSVVAMIPPIQMQWKQLIRM
jgi:hypothetical protein